MVYKLFIYGIQSVDYDSQESLKKVSLKEKKKEGNWSECLSLLNTPFLIPSLNLCLLASQEKAMAPDSSTLAWKIPWVEEPGRLQSMGSRRVRHD